MTEIKLIGSSHHETLVHSRVEEVIDRNDFDTVFVEGVDAETGEIVEKYVNKWTSQLKDTIGRTADATEDGRFREAEALEESFDGEIHYLDTGKTAFQNAKDTVKTTLMQLKEGKMTETPAVLLQEEADADEFESVMRMYLPDPDMVYEVFTREMDDQEYRQRLEDSMVELFRSQYRQRGQELPSEQEETLRANVREKAPDRERLREMLVNDVYRNDNEQQREEEWLSQFTENYGEAEKTAVFVGLAHTSELEDTFYTKLLEEGYEVDRRSLKDYRSF